MGFVKWGLFWGIGGGANLVYIREPRFLRHPMARGGARGALRVPLAGLGMHIRISLRMSGVLLQTARMFGVWTTKPGSLVCRKCNHSNSCSELPRARKQTDKQSYTCVHACVYISNYAFYVCMRHMSIYLSIYIYICILVYTAKDGCIHR